MRLLREDHGLILAEIGYIPGIYWFIFGHFWSNIYPNNYPTKSGGLFSGVPNFIQNSSPLLAKAYWTALPADSGGGIYVMVRRNSMMIRREIIVVEFQRRKQ